jgi:RNA polymerase sigma-70 factor (ECF subfamily)
VSTVTHPDDWSAADDIALHAGITARYPAALAEAHRRYAGAVATLAERILRDRARAEEVGQEVFLRLWQRPDRFDAGRGSLRTFLLTCAHTRSVDVLRADASRRAREERDLAVRRTAAVPAWPDDELTLDVLDALGSLTAAERQTIGLAYLYGYSYREVAALLGVPEGTVKSRIRAALGRLRASLTGVEAS